MKLRGLLLASFTLFVIIQIATSSFSSVSDGNDNIGFPFTFYKYLGGKRYPEPDNRYHFITLSFLADIIITFLVPFGALLFWQKLKVNKSKN